MGSEMCIRDRDVAVSFYEFMKAHGPSGGYNGPWEFFARIFMEGKGEKWISIAQPWTGSVGHCVIRVHWNNIFFKIISIISSLLSHGWQGCPNKPAAGTFHCLL